MKTVALISGGKDSCFNMMCCIAEGHEILGLANLRPEKEGQHELDSYMFQTVGHTAIDLYAEALGLPLYVQTITGSSLATGGDYLPQEGDEVEDLYKLLQAVKEDIQIEAVSVGAILSDYQRVRVENVCNRLGLSVLSYLWRRDQEELLQEMIECGVKAKIIKVAAMGLTPKEHLGMELADIQPHMLKMKSKYGLNVCGEGGEYETFVYDCPLFEQKINIQETECVVHSDDAFAPVGYLVLKSCSLQPKSGLDVKTPLQKQMLRLPLLTSRKWLAGCGCSPPACRTADDAESTGVTGAEGGGGDSGLPGVLICVPDVNLNGLEPPIFKTDGTNFLVSGVRAVTGRDTDLTTATNTAINSLKECLINHDMKTEDITSVSLYVGDMSNFAAINDVYKLFFSLNPPVRVCVEANLPRNVALQLDCQGRLQGSSEAENDRKVLHVQALSHWAPANIGPYSQAVVTNGKLYMAGIVPLVPATLAVVDGDITTQSDLALIHVQTVMSVITPACHLGNCPLVTCYVTKPEYVDSVRPTWERALKASLAKYGQELEEDNRVVPYVQYVQVSKLPKSALVEWHVSAWLSLEDDNDISVVKEAKHLSKYSVQAVAQHCVGKSHLFSCSIVTEVSSADFIQNAEKPSIPRQMVEVYCQVWHRCFTSGNESESCPPLVKIFFSPTVFDYTLLHKYFAEAVAIVCSSQGVPGPLMSLVPISGLNSSKQILAWCQ